MLVLLFASPATAFEVYTNTGNAAIAESISFGNKGVNVTAIYLSFAVAPTTSENLVIRVGSATGSKIYDADIATVQSYATTDKIPVAGYDSIPLRINYTNTDTEVWTLVVISERAAN